MTGAYSTAWEDKGKKVPVLGHAEWSECAGKVRLRLFPVLNPRPTAGTPAAAVVHFDLPDDLAGFLDAAHFVHHVQKGGACGCEPSAPEANEEAK